MATKAKLGSKPATQPLPEEPGLGPKGANPTGEGLSLPGLGGRLQPKANGLPRPIAQPIGAPELGPVGFCLEPPHPRQKQGGSDGPDQRRHQPGTAWNHAHWPGRFHRGRPRGGPSGGNGTGAHSATRPGPILAIPRDTLGDGSPSRKAASINQIGRSQGLPSTPANQSVPVQRWQRRGAVALGELLIAEAMGRPP